MDSFIGGAQNAVDSSAPWWMEFENTPKDPEKNEYYLGAYQKVYNHGQNPDFLQQKMYSGNNYLGSSLWSEMRKVDVSSFNNLYSDAFGIRAPFDNSLHYNVDVSGAYTKVREKAAKDIIEYMESKGILKKEKSIPYILTKGCRKMFLGRQKLMIIQMTSAYLIFQRYLTDPTKT